MAGGADLSFLKPLDPQGNLYQGRLGCHRGNWEHLNVRNPRPGCVYYHANRRQARIASLVRRGFEVVKQGDPEYLGEVTDEHMRAAGLDGVIGTAQTVLMRRSEELSRREKELSAARNRAHMLGATDEYLAKTNVAGETHYSKSGRPIRFKEPRHGIRQEER